jgi:hypothetical protein
MTLEPIPITRKLTILKRWVVNDPDGRWRNWDETVCTAGISIYAWEDPCKEKPGTFHTFTIPRSDPRSHFWIMQEKEQWIITEYLEGHGHKEGCPRYRGALRPECDPQATPRMSRRGRPAMCTCNRKDCRYCRERASGRKWYRKKAAERKAQKQVTKDPRDKVADSILDARALANWPAEWGARA